MSRIWNVAAAFCGWLDPVLGSGLRSFGNAYVTTLTNVHDTA